MFDTEERLRARLVRWCQTAYRRITDDLERLDMHKAVRNSMLLLDRIEEFERRAMASREALDGDDERAMAFALILLIRMVAPMAPHIAEELWARAGGEGLVANLPWPQLVEPEHSRDGAAGKAYKQPK